MRVPLARPPVSEMPPAADAGGVAGAKSMGPEPSLPLPSAVADPVAMRTAPVVELLLMRATTAAAAEAARLGRL